MTPGVHDALLVIDVQHDFVDGSVAIPDAAAIIPVVNRVSPLFRHVVFTLDWHPPGHVSFASSHPGARSGDVVSVAYGEQSVHAQHCVQGQPGARLHDALDLRAASMLLHKGCQRDIDSFSAFVENDRRTSTGLAAWLRERGVSRVFLAGLALYGCVRMSALDAIAAGFESVIIDDACRARPSPRNDDYARQFEAAGVARIASARLVAASAAAA
ncbi:MAG: isochorismatase family protein [Pigmentiphaga sp.]|uniref:isochorismatase family protein n=1 Tax=Pigmentiphaga sp. TaxID=1977564 RepID=UPI0029B5D934|nr:isochorismatase family protein [Pigmentiphaga sp.]MDX3905744.1 isochorismatase family protein [Pigmentiphaga sp.]